MVDANRRLLVALRDAESASTEAACGEAFQRGRPMLPRYPCETTAEHGIAVYGGAALRVCKSARLTLVFFDRPCLSRLVFLSSAHFTLPSVRAMSRTRACIAS